MRLLINKIFLALSVFSALIGLAAAGTPNRSISASSSIRLCATCQRQSDPWPGGTATRGVMLEDDECMRGFSLPIEGVLGYSPTVDQAGVNARGNHVGYRCVAGGQ